MEEQSHHYQCVCGREMMVSPFCRGKLVWCRLCRNFLVVPNELHGRATLPSMSQKTSRLQIRPAHSGDWRVWHEIHADARNYDFEISLPPSIPKSRKYLKASSYPGGFLKSNRLVFLVFLENGVPVGSISVTFTQPYFMATLGLMFHHEHQGKGYGTEAVEAVCHFLVKDLGVDKVSAMCDSKNLACRRLFEKVGFKSEGMVRKFFYHPERGWLDSPMYAFFREN